MSSDRKLETIANDVVLSPEDYNLTPIDPGAVFDIMGDWLRYAGAIEQEVPGNADLVRTITNNRSDSLDTFLHYWEAQEGGHGNLLSAQAEILGVECNPKPNIVPLDMRILGKAASIAPSVAELTEHVFLIDGALAEDETMHSYRIIARRLISAGEHEIARALLDVAKQESRHRAYYVDAFSEADVSPLTTRVTRYFVENLYRPVGLPHGKNDRTALFGNAILGTVGEDFWAVSDSVESLAGRMIGAKPGFLSKIYIECILEAQKEKLSVRP